MARRVQVLQEAKHALDTFLASRSSFRVVHSVEPAVHRLAEKPKTLFILDSSFNPPSVAHLSLAESALDAARSADQTRYAAPHALLLLFSVHNADKSPAPAAFEQRLAMMMALAEDIQRQTRTQAPIHVGLTTQPFYSDKSAAIEQQGAYGRDTRHVHLVGYDTFVRIFDPKYYRQQHTPPLSALEGYFKHHGLRVTLRPQAEWGGNEEQGEFLRRLDRGELEGEGAKRAWAREIDVVDGHGQGVGVSSTLVREAVAASDWATVRRMCSEGVAQWIQDMEPFEGS